MKKLMILGGSRYILPVIKMAHLLGCYVITCDYLPNNIAHKYSDEYCNVSIIEKDKVLAVARKKQIDGIMSFACDPGVETAAYVAEKMGLLNVGPYESVKILQNKGKFRKFLKDNNFNVPVSKVYKEYDDVIKDINMFNWPVIVKPTDSAGSKGVSKVSDEVNLKEAVEFALKFSHNGEFIVEEFLDKVGCSSDCDTFVVDGQIKAMYFSSQRFDIKSPNQYVPSVYSWPETICEKNKENLKKEVQRLLNLLKMNSAVYNIETRECSNGKAYIMECSPRGGGNRLSEMIRYMTDTDFLKASIQATLGMKIDDIVQKEIPNNWIEIILHSEKDGIFESVEIDESIKKYLIDKDLWINKGDRVKAFCGANEAIGTVIMNFNKNEKLILEVINNLEKYIKVNVK